MPNYNFIDLTGKRIGKLVVIKLINDGNKKERTWLCKCDCGNYKEVAGRNLRSQHTKSCGCLVKDLKLKFQGKNNPNYKHGMVTNKLYPIWNEMKQRCYNSNNKRYSNYGRKKYKCM